MNNIALQGYIRDIEFSHDVGNVEYNKANVVCPGINGKDDDLISLRFKKFCNKYKEGDFIEIKGNVRSFSLRNNDGTNNVNIYVFTYFDLPDIPVGETNIDGRICKIGDLKENYTGNKYIHFTLANNIVTSNNKINSYIPCTAYGEVAEQLSQCSVNDFINITGELHSHTYKRKLDKEIILAHELIVKQFYKV